jgi:hypothetical protein
MNSLYNFYEKRAYRFAMQFHYEAALVFCLGIICCGEAVADMLPCSKRYTKTVDYPLSLSDVGKDPRQVLDRWQLEGRSWGWERVRIHKNAMSQKPVIGFLYPKGSINPANHAAPQGGASFYVHGGFGQNVNAACLQYRVYFPPKFEFAKGGKLPGLYGGRNVAGESAAGCREGIVEDGFSLRYMWREEGAGSLYAYIPGKSESCGKYIGKGSWHFTPGKWTTLEQEVVLNTPGESNGVVRVWADNKLVIDEPHIALRTKDSVAIDGIFFVSFFGGKETEWASPKDQLADFADVRVAFP